MCVYISIYIYIYIYIYLQRVGERERGGTCHCLSVVTLPVVTYANAVPSGAVPRVWGLRFRV